MRPLVAPQHSLLYNGLDSNIKERVQSVVKGAAKLSSSPFFFCYQPFFFSPLCYSALAKRNAKRMETRENKDFRAEFIPVNVFLIHVFLRIQEYIAVYIDVSEELHTLPISNYALCIIVCRFVFSQIGRSHKNTEDTFWHSHNTQQKA